jgi:hypothetical protein
MGCDCMTKADVSKCNQDLCDILLHGTLKLVVESKEFQRGAT